MVFSLLYSNPSLKMEEAEKKNEGKKGEISLWIDTFLKGTFL